MEQCFDTVFCGLECVEWTHKNMQRKFRCRLVVLHSSTDVARFSIVCELL